MKFTYPYFSAKYTINQLILFLRRKISLGLIYGITSSLPPLKRANIEKKKIITFH